MTLKFGTDGVRGAASELTDELVEALGTAAVSVLDADRFVIGRDTRWSGPRIEASLRRGIEAAGVSAEGLGVVPTPAVALVSSDEQVAGAVISASHNPFADNGIKFFAPGGLKLTDATEAELEAELDRVLAAGRSAEVVGGGAADGADAGDGGADDGGADAVGANHGRFDVDGGFVGGVVSPTDARPLDAVDGGVIPPAHPGPGAFRTAPAELQRIGRYVELVQGSVAGRDLAGMKVVIDCANGAASLVAPAVLDALGVDLLVLHAEPDGTNINADCGSTHPESLQSAVVEAGADVGLAFDGDADRVLAVDERGRLVDGDELIGLCAIDLRERGELAHDTVVVTVMTNLGFHLGMAEHGVKVVQTQVGDRYVLEGLEAGGYVLGGEQSGHAIFRRLATTGDGLLTGVQLLDLVRRSGRPLSELAAGAMRRLPQVLENVRVAHRDPEIARAIASEIAVVEADLGATGRVLVRPSGTEPLVRVMVEAPEATTAQQAADRLVAAVVAACGAPPGE